MPAWYGNPGFRMTFPERHQSEVVEWLNKFKVMFPSVLGWTCDLKFETAALPVRWDVRVAFQTDEEKEGVKKHPLAKKMYEEFAYAGHRVKYNPAVEVPEPGHHPHGDVIAKLEEELKKGNIPPILANGKSLHDLAQHIVFLGKLAKKKKLK